MPKPTAPKPAAKPTRGRPKQHARRPTPCADLIAALRSLPATRDGFEGLTASLIDAATGGALRLLASGDQLGVDGIADPVAVEPRRAMQSKRYKESTPLDRTGLLGEMAAAHEAWPSIDCWILAATKSLHGTVARAVRLLAEEYGWGFVPLDWSEVAPGFPRLATLCAAFPDIACRWGAIAAVRATLDTLACKPEFPAARAALLAELRAADTGFAAARTAAISSMDTIFSDSAAARSIAGPSPAWLAQAPPVTRISLRSSIAKWWASGASIGVLLGVEGAGKTWGALDSLRHLSGQVGSSLPVVITSWRAGQATDGWEALIVALGSVPN